MSGPFDIAWKTAQRDSKQAAFDLARLDLADAFMVALAESDALQACAIENDRLWRCIVRHADADRELYAAQCRLLEAGGTL